MIDFESFDFNDLFPTANNFAWAKLNHTLHGAIQHSVELIQLNDDEGLGPYSEEGLEANNKDIRRYLEELSRKSDGNQQLEDIHQSARTH